MTAPWPARLRMVLAAALAIALLQTAPGTGAQPPSAAHRIGWLAPAPNADNLDALRAGLRALGYLEGTHVSIVERYADGGTEQLAGVATQLGRNRLDVIVADGSAAALGLKRAAVTTPVVFVSGDPVAFGLVPSLSRPSGTMTGVAVVSTELNVKRLDLLKTTFPRVARLGVLHEPRQMQTIVPPLEAGARALGLHLTRMEVRATDELEPMFALAVRERVAVVMVVSSALLHANKQRIVSLAERHRLPTMYETRAFPEAGGLMSYGPDMGDVFRRAASYVDRVLKGARAADLPIEQPTKFELIVNQRTARALGLTLPPALLQRADHIIE